MSTLSNAINTTLYGAGFPGDDAFLAFSAPLTHSLNEGKNDLDSFTRGASTAATVRDFEGIIKDVTADEVRFVGARRVENLAPNIHDGWIDLLDTSTEYVDDNTRRLTSVHALGLGGYYKAGVVLPVGSEVIGQLEVRIVSGFSSLLTFTVYTGKDNVQQANLIGSLVDGEWVRLTPGKATNTVAANLGFSFTYSSGTVVLDVRNVQYEDVTGQTNQNPSEYVSVGAATQGYSNIITDTGMNDASAWDTVDFGDVNTTKPSKAVFTSAIFEVAKMTEVGFDIKAGELYAFTYTIENAVSGGMQPLIGAVQLGVSKSSNGTHIQVVRATTDTNIVGLRSGGINGFTGDIDNLTVTKVDHGSNVDGVKYFDTFNLNYIDNNVVKSHTAGQLISNESEFATADSSSGGTDGRWEWVGAGTCVIEDGVLKHAANFDNLKTFYQDMADPEHPFNSLRTHLQGTALKVEYRLNGDVDLTSSTPVEIGDLNTDIWGNTFPITADTDLVAYGTADASVTHLVHVELGVDNTLEVPYFRVFIADKIPDATLKGVLIEEGSTNFLHQSEDFQTTWVPTNITFGTDIKAPSGVVVAEQISATADGNALVQYNINTTVPGDYTFSFYAKSGVSTWAACQSTGFVGGTNGNTYFNIDGVAVGTDTMDASGIESVGDGWVRCWATFAVVAGDLSGSLRIFIADADLDVTVTAGDDIYIWGAQLENLSYPTSYMPTSGASVSRGLELLKYKVPASLAVADVKYLSMFATTYRPSPSLGAGTYVPINIGDTAPDNQVRLVIVDTTGTIIYLVEENTATTSAIGATALAAGFHKIGLVYDGEVATHFYGYLDGSAESDNGTSLLSDLDLTDASCLICIGGDVLDTNNVGLYCVKDVKMYNTEISQTKAEELTTL